MKQQGNGMQGMSDKSGIIIPNFYRLEPHELETSDVGWTKSDMSGATTDDPEMLFRYYIDITGFNMAFYYIDDGCFYNIFTEQLPVTVHRMRPNPNWDGKYVIDSVIGGGSTHATGEVIYSTDDATKIWNELRIGGKSIGEVLKRSVILTLD